MAHPDYNAYGDWDKRLKSGICLSLILHALFLAILFESNKRPLPKQQFIEVSIIPPIETKEELPDLNPRQIVETPDNPENTKLQNEPARLLSDKDFQTEHQQIKRGDSKNAGPSVSKQLKTSPALPAVQNHKSKPENKSNLNIEKSPPRLNTLRLDQETLFEKFSSDKPSKTSSNEPNPAYQAFTRPAGSGAAFIGLNGSSDYLPDLPDGDITLLNAKADKYAVFVRRVASLVFSHMRSTGWETLHSSDIYRINDYCTIRAVLNPRGQLIKISLESSSGSSRFDETLATAVKSGAHDPNPPKDAMADDGNYHFIFKSKSWSKTSFAPKTGAPFERRWLLLATGLY